jgi:multidrug resistance efflux pump
LARLRAREEDARIELAEESERVAVSKVDLELDDYMQQTTDSLFDLELVSERERRKVQRDRAATNVAVKSGRTIVYRRRAQLREVQAVIKNQFRMMAQREQLGEAKVAALETKLARYRRELEATIIRAPCDGVVANAYTPSGSLVNVGDTVLSIVDTSQLSVAVFVPEEELGNVNLGLHEELRVRFNAHPLRAVSATVTEQYARLSSNPTLVAPGLDPYQSAHSAQEGLVLASKANVARCPFELRPGMTGTVILGRRRASWPLEVALRAVTRTVGL